MNDKILHSITETLYKQGATEDQIADTVIRLIDVATDIFYAKALELFSEEDLVMIEKYTDEKELNSFVIKLYKERTGNDPQSEIDTYLLEVVKELQETDTKTQS